MDYADTVEHGLPEIAHPHIGRNPAVLGGEPVIHGTRIGVRHIVEWDRQGHNVDEIVGMYPQLTHAQVHDALSYYFDHRAEINGYIDENSEASVKSDYRDRPWMK